MADRFATRLAAEIQGWIRDGLVSSEQRTRILARYPTEAGWLSISTLAPTQIIGRAPEWSEVGRRVYVALTPRDGLHVVVGASLDRGALPLPPGQRLIVGRLRHAQMARASAAPLGVEYGIERYYVPEGKGTPPPGRLEADVSLTADGRAFLTRLFVDGKPYP